MWENDEKQSNPLTNKGNGQIICRGLGQETRFSKRNERLQRNGLFMATTVLIRKVNCLSDNYRSSKNISQLGAVIADLPIHHREFRLITPGKGCVDTLPTGGMNMQYDCQLHHTSWAKESIFLFLFLTSNWVIFSEEAPLQYSLQGPGWGRHSANKS